MPPFPPTLIHRDVSFFAGLTRAELERARALFTVVTPVAGTGLGREGEIARELVVVLDGHVLASARGVPIAVLGPGDHFGAVPLLGLAGGHRRRASFQVLDRSAVAVATRAEFRALCQDVPVIERRARDSADRALSSGATDRPWEGLRTPAPSPSSRPPAHP